MQERVHYGFGIGDGPATGVMALGKVPARREFLPARGHGPAALELARWVDEGAALMARVGTALPRVPCCFCFSPGSGRGPLVGVITGSCDAVGRPYPLVLFRSATVYGADMGVAELFCMARSFYVKASAAVQTMVSSVAEVATPEMFKQLASGGSCESVQVGEVLRRTPASLLLGSFRHSGGASGLIFAYETVLQACLQAVSSKSGARLSGPDGGAVKSVITLDCPLGEATMPIFWLELVRRLLGGDGAGVSYFASMGAPSRLLLSLGSAPAAICHYLSDAGYAGPRLWPLVSRAGHLSAPHVSLFSPCEQAMLADGRVRWCDVLDLLVGKFTQLRGA